MSNTIWVVGSANYDTTYEVEKLPQRGETMLTRGMRTSPGGKGLNQAIAAAHWKAQVAFVGAWGRDATGKILAGALAGHGVDTSLVTETPEEASGHAIIYVDRRGDNTIIVHPGANALVPALPADFVKPGDFLATQLEIPLEIASHYLRRAKAAGATTLLNPSPIVPLDDAFLKNVDIVVLNESEAAGLGGVAVDSVDSALFCARAIGKRGPSRIVVTLGRDGAAALDGGRAFHVPGYELSVVDTQGAGDIFLGAFVAHLFGGGSFEEAVVQANRAAAASVMIPGSTYASLARLGERPELPAQKVERR